MAKTHNLFISHSWAYSDNYEKLIGKLRERPYFFFKDYSVPKNDPIHTKGTDKELYEAIKRKISPCGVIIMLAGVYSTYSKWINKEIIICNDEFTNKKPILAIEPFASQKTSTIAKDNADLIVKWNTESIIKGIRELN
jgi:hypothetical protein